MPTPTWLQFEGQTCLVAGAGGLGGTTAIELARQGARVMLADISNDNLTHAQRRAADDGVQIDIMEVDLRTPDACRHLVADAITQLGSLDVFVHAVGRNIRQPVLDLDDDAWAQILNLNLSTAYWLGQAVGRSMCARKSGRMVFVSSVSSWLAHPHHAPYAATKGGLNQLMRVMAREWAAEGVSVNAVAPGYIETELTRAYLDTDGHREQLSALVPAGRLGQPNEVADAIVFLASARAHFITGHVLYVDGGRTLV